MLLNNTRSWHVDINPGTGLLTEEYRRCSFINDIKNWNESTSDYYYLEFKSPIAFEKVNIKSLIPNIVFNRINDINDNCYLVLVNSHEGFLNNIFDLIYNNFVYVQGIPPYKIILFTGALNSKEELERFLLGKNIEPIRIEFMLDLAMSSHGTLTHLNSLGKVPPNTLELKQYDKKYLCFNRRWRVHRPMLVSLLCATNLLDKGYVSLGKADYIDSWPKIFPELLARLENNKEIHALLENNKEKILSLPDLYLDTTDLVTNRAEIVIEPDIDALYTNSYFSVVNETYGCTKYLHDEKSCFLSEKIFKPIIFKHPFILVSTPRTLEFFKKIGYKTFSPFIDESYDTIADDGDRMWAIVKEIERLCNLSDNDLEQFLIFSREITEFNYNKFINTSTFIFSEF